MEDDPRNLTEFETRFGSEEACREYLFQLRRPEGFRCPRCGHDQAWPVREVLWQGTRCGRQAAVTAGTIFQDSRKPLTLWFRAIWWVTSQKNGSSALGLQRVLGLGSYKTAWSWLHKLRRAMVRPGRDRLGGRVELDETYLGGVEEGVRGRQTEAKALIAVAAEVDGVGIGRLRMATIPDASAESLMAFVGEAIKRGSVVPTDGWLGYAPLPKRGYQHRVTFLEGPESASRLLPEVHRVVSLLNAGWWGRIRGRSATSAWMTTSTSSGFVSTGANRAAGASCSTVWRNRPSPLILSEDEPARSTRSLRRERPLCASSSCRGLFGSLRLLCQEQNAPFPRRSPLPVPLPGPSLALESRPASPQDPCSTRFKTHRPPQPSSSGCLQIVISQAPTSEWGRDLSAPSACDMTLRFFAHRYPRTSGIWMVSADLFVRSVAELVHGAVPAEGPFRPLNQQL